MNHLRHGFRLKLGLLVNPRSGIGGPAGLRGSDGDGIQALALARGSLPMAQERVRRCLTLLAPLAAEIEWLTWDGDMGATVLRAAGFAPRVCGAPTAAQTTAADTEAAAGALAREGVSLLLFAGGDGTARDVCRVIGDRVPALGIPAGVKMYSGVFAVSPEAAADIVARLVGGEPVAMSSREVRDIDEEAFRLDRVVSRWFGDMSVPGAGGQLQQVKCGAPLDEELARDDIAAGVLERLDTAVLCLVGTGTTPKAVLRALGLEGSLLGIDAVFEGRLLARDLDAFSLPGLLDTYPRRCLIVTATGGQGFLFGRGNQQLSAPVLRKIGIDNIVIVATPGKLAALAGRPLRVDTGDAALDHELAGLRTVWTGYASRVLYRVTAACEPATE